MEIYKNFSLEKNKIGGTQLQMKVGPKGRVSRIVSIKIYCVQMRMQPYTLDNHLVLPADGSEKVRKRRGSRISRTSF